MTKFLLDEMKENVKWIPLTEIKEESLYPLHRASAQRNHSSSTDNEPPRWESTGKGKEFEGLEQVFSDEVVKCLSERFNC